MRAAGKSSRSSAFSAPYTLENYHAILVGSQISRWLLNSLIVSLGTTAGQR